jgi:hypothetical protein
MAEQTTIKLPYVLRQDRSSNPKKTGKYYGRIWSKGLLNTRGLADHMTEHGLVRNTGKVYTVLSKLTECIPELLAQGVGIKLDGLGTLYPSIQSKGVTDPRKYVVGKHMQGIRIHILPWNSADNKLTSKAFMKRCQLEYVGEVETIEVGGKKKIILHRPVEEEP